VFLYKSIFSERKCFFLPRSDNGEGTLELIYSKTPSAVIALLDKSISFDCATGLDNFTKTERSYIVDFT
jgi:hypothetical protein